MAHEVDEASSRKRIIRWENGQPVYAEPSTESATESEEEDDGADTETSRHEAKEPDN